MQTVTVNLSSGITGQDYPIHIGHGVLGQPELLLPHLSQKRVAIVTNTTVAPLYLEKLRSMLESYGVASLAIVLPDGEEHKSGHTLNRVYDALLQERCERKTTLIALGGGVIGDLTGFAAASYLRGVPYIQIPTTLLAQVDSSVGGKTGINHALGKNMIGAFYQPRVVLADSATLDTLPDRELRAGLAEVIKYGLICDMVFFEWLEQNIEKLLQRDPDALNHAIHQSCTSKARIVALDEKENGVRALLNLGHTFGHAIENGMGYGTWLHGEAVAAGTILAAELSWRLNMLGEDDVDRIRELYIRAGLPVVAPDLGKDQYLRLMKLDKKTEDGRMRFIVLRRIGEAVIRPDIPLEHLVVTLLEHNTVDE